jgi:lactoylglutathione lyase
MAKTDEFVVDSPVVTKWPRGIITQPSSSAQKLNAKLIYTGIRVKDLEKSIEFYTKVLGMRVTGRSKIEATKGETVGLVSEEGGHLLELNYYGKGSDFDTKYAVGDGLDHLAFQVDDLKKAIAEAAKAGYGVVLDMKTQTSRWTYIQDPNGIYIELFGK